MSETFVSALVLTPLLLALVASAAAWRFVSRPMLFLVISALSLLGVQAVLSPVAVSWFFFQGGATHDAFVHSVATGTTGVVVLGIPILWWLFKGLRRA
jgi:hypothetical protein